MAWYFGLYAECGREKRQANSLSAHFHNYQCAFTDGLITICMTWINQDSEKNWWVHIWPQGISEASPHGNREELKDARHVTEAGFDLYSHLKTSDAYRYAIVGWEAEEFRLYNEFDPEDFENFDGLVLSTAVWNTNGQPKGFTEFSTGYLWRPWNGDDRLR